MPTVLLLLRLFAVLAIFRALGWPIARLALPGLPATSWALATTVGLVLSAHVTWLLAQAGVTLGAPSIAAGMAIVAGAAGAAYRALGRAGAAALPSRKDVVVHAVAFGCALLLALLVTAKNPAVDPDSERFMDYAMTNAVLASRHLPLEDPWLAGERVAYYDYGYYAVAHLAILVGSPPRFFLVAVALLHAALLAGVLALGRDLVSGIGGLLAAWFVSLAGNLDALLQTLRQGLSVPLDWFHGARVINGTITEFPWFTLLWGDLHPYALALPLWPLLLGVIVVLWRDGAGLATVATGAVSLAALVATHTWDGVPIAALLVLAGLARPRPGRQSLYPPLLVIGAGALLALPFLLHVPTGGRGLAWVIERSSLAELFTAWGAPAVILLVAALVEVAADPALGRAAAPAAIAGGLIVAAFPTPGVGLAVVASAVALALAWRGPRERSFAWGAAAIGAGLVAGVELLYVDDFYTGELERMNTVFKAYVEAWVLLSLAAALLLAGLVARARGAGRGRRVLVLCLATFTVLATALYPLRATPARCGSLLAPRGLDARSGFRERYPDDAAAAEQLGRLPRGVLLETTGDPYTWNGRFASFTGYPAVVGWGHHEAGWRNTWQPMLDRMRDVKEAYNAPTLAQLQRLIDRYRVRYVVVGALEREQYPAESLKKFEALPAPVRTGQTVIYEVPQARLGGSAGVGGR